MTRPSLVTFYCVVCLSVAALWGALKYILWVQVPVRVTCGGDLFLSVVCLWTLFMVLWCIGFLNFTRIQLMSLYNLVTHALLVMQVPFDTICFCIYVRT